MKPVEDEWVPDFDFVPATFARELEREVNQLRAALELGQENCDAVYEDLRKERDEARRELAEVQQDRARLDWLQSGHDVFRWQKDGPSDGQLMHGWIVGGAGLELARSSVRDAIDAAVEAMP